MAHVLEPLSGYLALAMHLNMRPQFHGESFNFGPLSQQNYSVKELVESMALKWDRVQWRDVSERAVEHYESGLLKLNCDKALHQLNWRAVMDFEETIQMTVDWYKTYYKTPDIIFDLTISQIEQYCSLAKDKKLFWAL